MGFWRKILDETCTVSVVMLYFYLLTVSFSHQWGADPGQPSGDPAQGSSGGKCLAQCSAPSQPHRWCQGVRQFSRGQVHPYFSTQSTTGDVRVWDSSAGDRYTPISTKSPFSDMSLYGGRGLWKNKAEEAKNWRRQKFILLGKACEATDWPALGF